MIRVKHFLNKKNLAFLAHAIFIYTLATYFALNARIKISWDGTLYLVSAKVFSSSKMGPFYDWIREPGYPIFLKLFVRESYHFQEIIAIQTYILTTANLMLLAFFYFNSARNSQRIIYLGASIISFWITIGFASWILQQFFFLLLASIHVWFSWYAYKKQPKLKTLIFISSLILLLTSFWSIILLPASVVAIYFCLRENVKNDLFFTFKIFTLMLLPTLIFLSYWNYFKIETIQKSGRIEFYNSEKVVLTDYGKTDPLKLIYLAPSNLGGILGYSHETSILGTERPLSSYWDFAFSNRDGGIQCGRFAGGPVEITDELRLDFEAISRCSESQILGDISSFGQVSQKFIPGFIFLAFLITVGLISRRDTLAFRVLPFPLVAVLPYLLEPRGSARYGIPFIYLAPFLVAYFISTNFKKFQK